MVIFSIIHRELIGAARKRVTYLARSASAGIALLVFAIVSATHHTSMWRLGNDLLQVIALFAFVEAFIAGARFTSDCISEEKREGTIGLLFLTHMSALEVVVGKLVTRSLGAIYNLTAIMPVFWLCILVGGVTWRQIIAITVLLFCTTIFSLSCGIYISCRGMQEKQVLIGSLALPAAVYVLPLMLWSILNLIFQDNPAVETLLLLSPIYAHKIALYNLTPGLFYTCAWIALLSLLFVLLGARHLKRNSLSVVEESHSSNTARELKTPRLRPRLVRLEYLGSANPAHWLAWQRQNRKSPIAFCIVALFFGLIVRILLISKAHYGPPVAIFGTYFLHATYKFMVTAEAARQLNHDRRNGALELLLSTPLTPDAIVSGVYDSTQRLLRPAAICLAICNLTWMSDREFFNDVGVFLPCSVILIFTDTFALTWRGMAIGLRGDSYVRSVMRAYRQVMLAPIASLLIFFSFGTGMAGISKEEVSLVILLWTGMSILFDVYRRRQSRSELTYFRKIASGDYDFKRIRQTTLHLKQIARFQPASLIGRRA
jgi:ABC-type transport system involved in cytochrome c biogenesis permease component